MGVTDKTSFRGTNCANQGTPTQLCLRYQVSEFLEGVKAPVNFILN
jgi:hypothetical protein